MTETHTFKVTETHTFKSPTGSAQVVVPPIRDANIEVHLATGEPTLYVKVDVHSRAEAFKLVSMVLGEEAEEVDAKPATDS